MKKTNLKLCFMVCAIAGIAITNTAQAQWSLTGNAGTTPGTHFVGTTDNKALYFKTNNANRLAISSAGKVGIGLTAPTAKFEIKAAGAAYDVVRFYNDKDATLDSSMIIRSNGYVGIGMSPAYKLDVAGDLRINNPGYGLLHTDGTTTLGTYADASAGWFGTLTNHPIWFFTNDNTYPHMVVQPSGKVGIGITAPVTRLQVNNTTPSPVSLTLDGLVVIGDKAGYNIAFDTENIQARNNGASAPLFQNFFGGDVQLGAPGVPFIYKEVSGNTGIGTLAPAEKLEVSGNIRLTRGAARSIYINDAPAGTNGNDLTLQAGGTPLFGANSASGGNLLLTAGNTNHASAQFGGNIIFTAGRNAWNTGANPGAKHGDIIFRGGGAGTTTLIVEHARIDGTTGAMALGTSTPSTGYRLTVAGKIICTELKVQVQPFPDYVFADNYNLKSIDEVEQHIKTYNRLPGMPGACEVEENGMNVGEIQAKVVEKVEENTLYIIQLKKEIDALKAELNSLKK